jgi:hypothetical protein
VSAGFPTSIGQPLGDAEALLLLKVEVILKKRYDAAPRVMRIGQRAEDVSPLLSIGSTSITDIDAFATVTFAVGWPAQDDKLPTLNYKRVEFVTPAEQQLRTAAMRDALSRGLAKQDN